MRKEDLISDLLYLLMAGIVLLVGFLVITPAINNGLLGREMPENVLFIIVALIVGIVLNVILMEVGHLIGAKIGGYTILSTNILGFNFYKDFSNNSAKGQLKFRFKSFNGLTGETIIEPKQEKSNPMFYVFFPLILFLLEFCAMYLVVMLAPKDADTHFETIQIIKYGLVISTTIAGCMVLYDYFPAKLDTMNDGYRLISLKKKINIEAFNSQLSMEAHEYKGDLNYEIKIFDEITDFTAKVNLEGAMRKFVEGNGEEAISIIDKCLENKANVSRSTEKTLLLNKIYIVYLTRGTEAGNELYKALDEETKDAVKRCKTYEGIRVYLLYIGLSEKSKSEIKYSCNKIKKYYDRLTLGEIAKEMKLVSLALEKIIDFDPKLVDKETIKDVCNSKEDNEIYKTLISKISDNSEKKEEDQNKKEETEEQSKEDKEEE